VLFIKVNTEMYLVSWTWCIIMKKHFLSMHMSRLLVLIFEPNNRQSVSLGLSKYAHLTTCLLTVHDICPKYSGGRKDRNNNK